MCCWYLSGRIQVCICAHCVATAQIKIKDIPSPPAPLVTLPRQDPTKVTPPLTPATSSNVAVEFHIHGIIQAGLSRL